MMIQVAKIDLRSSISSQVKSRQNSFHKEKNYLSFQKDSMLLNSLEISQNHEILSWSLENDMKKFNSQILEKENEATKS